MRQVVQVQVDGVVARQSVEVHQFGLLLVESGSPRPLRVEPLTDQRVVDAVAVDVHLTGGGIGDAAAPVDRHVEVGVGVVDDVAVRGAHQFAHQFAVLAEDDGRRAALVGGHVVAVAQDLDVHEVVGVVVGQRAEAQVARTEDVRHLQRTVDVGVEELRHVAVLVPATDQTPLVIVEVSVE